MMNANQKPERDQQDRNSDQNKQSPNYKKNTDTENSPEEQVRHPKEHTRDDQKFNDESDRL